ncbi:hypothetical protein [Paenibacillus polymyxa]|uniref:hypothetical protein n=1 Tax=Paenibacillus polymyxa TaxID=1406 RepID=UPI002AB512B1|nr:hypothetical protein [Paenibacillus polymyxa]MDY8023360.1 hypothetical protein [Paenibacillus polymyxa]
MDRKIADNLMTANTPMGKEYRNHIMNGLTDEQVSKALGIDDITSTDLVREQTINQEAITKIQQKMDALMAKLKTETDYALLEHLANSGELLLTGLTMFDESKSNYQIVIDTYTAEKGYRDDNVIYQTADIIIDTYDDDKTGTELDLLFETCVEVFNDLHNTKKRDEADEVFSNTLKTLGNNSFWIDENGDYSM